MNAWILGCLAALLVFTGPARAADRGSSININDDGSESIDFATPTAELAELQKSIDRGEMPRVQFDFDSYKVRPESAEALQTIARIMLENPKIKLLITAHTCAIGSAKYNQVLSDRRAAAVKEYLSKLGVPPPSMHAKGKGFTEPIADNSTEEGREKNRRVEFKFLTRWWSAVY